MSEIFASGRCDENHVARDTICVMFPGNLLLSGTVFMGLLVSKYGIGPTEKSFQELKQHLASALVLAYFDRDAHTRVIADASLVGLGAVLVQEKNGESRAVCYASRSLSSVERRYSQMEKEALALVWACEHFNLYLYGLQTIDLVTDHEALKVIYSRGSKLSARIECWVLRL